MKLRECDADINCSERVQAFQGTPKHKSSEVDAGAAVGCWQLPPVVGERDTWKEIAVLALVALQAHQRYDGLATPLSCAERLQVHYWNDYGGGSLE